MSSPYDEFPDVLPVAEAPMVYRAETSYDSRQSRLPEDAFGEFFRERQAMLMARSLFSNPKFTTVRPWAPGMQHYVCLRFEALVPTQAEWDQKLAEQYEKGYKASMHARLYDRI